MTSEQILKRANQRGVALEVGKAQLRCLAEVVHQFHGFHADRTQTEANSRESGLGIARSLGLTMPHGSVAMTLIGLNLVLFAVSTLASARVWRSTVGFSAHTPRPVLPVATGAWRSETFATLSTTG